LGVIITFLDFVVGNKPVIRQFGHRVVERLPPGALRSNRFGLRCFSWRRRARCR
jgi:hypothetical protein